MLYYLRLSVVVVVEFLLIHVSSGINEIRGLTAEDDDGNVGKTITLITQDKKRT